MKSLSLALQSHLDEGTTTLAWCWRITRADGMTLGFTDHDRTLSFDGTEFEPESGLTASEVRSGSDLSVDAQDAQGVLSSDRITETDILDGRWDNAEVEVWRVNWADPSQRVLMRRGAGKSSGATAPQHDAARRPCACGKPGTFSGSRRLIFSAMGKCTVTRRSRRKSVTACTPIRLFMAKPICW